MIENAKKLDHQIFLSATCRTNIRNLQIIFFSISISFFRQKNQNISFNGNLFNKNKKEQTLCPLREIDLGRNNMTGTVTNDQWNFIVHLPNEIWVQNFGDDQAAQLMSKLTQFTRSYDTPYFLLRPEFRQSFFFLSRAKKQFCLSFQGKGWMSGEDLHTFLAFIQRQLPSPECLIEIVAPTQVTWLPFFGGTPEWRRQLLQHRLLNALDRQRSEVMDESSTEEKLTALYRHYIDL